MDLEGLLTKRRRLAEEFRTKLNYVGVLRGRLRDARSDGGKESLRRAIDEGGAYCLQLGAELLELDASIIALRGGAVDHDNHAAG
jgi:hypothetical protein